MLKMQRHFSGGCKKSFLIVLTVFLFTVIFASCEKENKPEDNSDNNSATVSETSPFENTDDSQLNTTLPQYAFEEEEQVQNAENGSANNTVPDAKNESANTTASSGNGNAEKEISTVATPPKADSQQGEWGASVIN